MEGNLSMEDGDSSTNPTRRRVLKASAALSATGVVGSGFVGSAAAGHQPCNTAIQCDASVTFNDHTVGDNCGHGRGNAVDSATVAQAVVSCPDGGWLDLHDLTTDTGPSGSFKAGYIVGVSTWLQQGTHTDVCINLFENPVSDDIGACNNSGTISWNRNEWPTDSDTTGCRSMSAMLHLDSPSNQKWDHFCKHDGPAKGDDHAYLCDANNDGNRTPVLDKAEICGDGNN